MCVYVCERRYRYRLWMPVEYYIEGRDALLSRTQLWITDGVSEYLLAGLLAA